MSQDDLNDDNLDEFAERLQSSSSRRALFASRQLLLNACPPSYFVENYLEINEGVFQTLDDFPMMRFIYDNASKDMLLKCSRKTLKSTLLSNLICLDLIRRNDFSIMYIVFQEESAKYFSSMYVAKRFKSKKVKNLLTQGFERDDVFNKIIRDTQSSLFFKYVKNDATRTRGPAVDANYFDEVQAMLYDVLMVVTETMALSKFRQKIYAGTPLSTGNTIHQLWKDSSMCEWMVKCLCCNHWNALIEENNPIKMITPKGYACSKCSTLLNSREGMWVSANPNFHIIRPNEEIDPEKKIVERVGYHLAQPMLPFYQTPDMWPDVYKKVHTSNNEPFLIYNEVFGLSYDAGLKVITEDELKALCVLGPMRQEGDSTAILHRNKGEYIEYTCGVDWGVSGSQSRTTCCFIGIRRDFTFDVFFCKSWKDLEYDAQIQEIANMAKGLNCWVCSDSAPDAIRGIRLAESINNGKTHLVDYFGTKLVHEFWVPPDARDWRTNRFRLHRSDTLNLTVRMLKQGRIRFPSYEGMTEECLSDLLNVETEVVDGKLNQELIYTKPDGKRDDFFHALNWALCQALLRLGDRNLVGPSSYARGKEVSRD